MVSACAAPTTNSEKGTAVGVGASAGVMPAQVIGGIAGNMIGSYMDKQEQEFQRQVAGREGTTVQRYRNDLSITMKADGLFDTGSSLMKPGGYNEIGRIAAILNRYPETRVTIEGHTDGVGSESYNMHLSEERARAVADALTAGGVNPRRLTTVGLGPSRPNASNNTETGRQLNRRITLLVVPIEA